MPQTYQIKSFPLGPMDNLVHIAWDIATNKAAIFDPAWDAKFLLEFITEQSLQLDKIIITHTHYDHINAIPELLNLCEVEIFISQDEFNNPQLPVLPDKANFVQDKTIINLGTTKISCISTPGHSIGGICYEFSNDVIMGDTIFIYGCGHCALPGANVELLFNSLQILKHKLKPGAIIHTSHSYGITNTSTWQQQLDGNPFLHIDDLADFMKYRLHLHDQMRTYPMAAISKTEVNQLFSN